MTERIEQLEQQLRDKERVVAALTERLEQAAEQLDRFRRTGADRGLRAATGIPPELIENHERLVAEMQQAVTHWEEAQPASVLERIEQRLERLQQSVDDGLSAAATASAMTPAQLPPASGADASSMSEIDEQPTASAAPHSSDGMSAWERLKHQMLEQEPAADSSGDAAAGSVAASTAAEPPTGAAVSESPPQGAPPVDDGPRVPKPEELPAPPPIDVAEASTGDLRLAVQARDEYILNLVRRLRYAELQSGRFEGWQQLESAPEQLHQELLRLQEQLNEQLRLAEVEMAVERAKVGREAARLQQVEMQLKKQLGNMGNAPEAAAGDKSAENGANRRWMRFLGVPGEQP